MRISEFFFVKQGMVSINEKGDEDVVFKTTSEGEE